MESIRHAQQKVEVKVIDYPRTVATSCQSVTEDEMDILECQSAEGGGFGPARIISRRSAQLSPSVPLCLSNRPGYQQRIVFRNPSELCVIKPHPNREVSEIDPLHRTNT